MYEFHSYHSSLWFCLHAVDGNDTVVCMMLRLSLHPSLRNSICTPSFLSRPLGAKHCLTFLPLSLTQMLTSAILPSSFTLVNSWKQCLQSSPSPTFMYIYSQCSFPPEGVSRLAETKLTHSYLGYPRFCKCKANFSLFTSKWCLCSACYDIDSRHQNHNNIVSPTYSIIKSVISNRMILITVTTIDIIVIIISVMINESAFIIIITIIVIIKLFEDTHFFIQYARQVP